MKLGMAQSYALAAALGNHRVLRTKNKIGKHTDKEKHAHKTQFTRSTAEALRKRGLLERLGYNTWYLTDRGVLAAKGV